MIPCSSCGVHVRVSDDACPGCGARRRAWTAPTAAALLMGLAACAGATPTDKAAHSGGTTPQPEYGVTVTDTVTDTTTDGTTTADGTYTHSEPGDTADTGGSGN